MARRNPNEARNEYGRMLDQHVAAHSLTKKLAQWGGEDAGDYREAADTNDLGSVRAAQAMRVENPRR